MATARQEDDDIGSSTRTDKPLLFQEVKYRQHTDPLWSGRMLMGDYTPLTAMMALPLIKNKKQAHKYRHEKYWKDLEGPLAELARQVYIIPDAELSSIDHKDPSMMQANVISTLAKIGSAFVTTPSSRGSALVYLRSKEMLSNRDKFTLLLCMGHVKEASLAAQDPEIHFHIPKFQTAIGNVRYDKPGPYVMEEDGLIYIRGDRIDPIDAVVDHEVKEEALPKGREGIQMFKPGEFHRGLEWSPSKMEGLVDGLGAIRLAYLDDIVATDEEAEFGWLDPL